MRNTQLLIGFLVVVSMLHMIGCGTSPETRFYVLEIDGWCKDMDRFTKDGQTVAPMPSAGKDPAIPEKLHEEYNTRYVSSSG